MEEEYANVKCYVNDEIVYSNFFFNVVKKEWLEKECKIKAEKFNKENPSCADDERLGILLVGIDSVSKSHFQRMFPLTSNYLVNNLKPFDFLGYNRVGLNTFACLMPYMTSHSKDDLEEGCWGANASNVFDNCTTIFDIFAEAGYRTAFMENMQWTGLFTGGGGMGGFKRQPAHYYGRTLYLSLMEDDTSYVSSGCWKGKMEDYWLMKWAYEFQKSFRELPHFGHFWMSRFSHDDINGAQQMDPFLADIIQKMDQEMLLNRTLFILMSDHGIRFGEFRETEIGRLEENLPFMYLVFPKWFLKKYPDAVDHLKYNTRRLITTYDLHEFLKSMLKCDYSNKTLMAMDEPVNRKRTSLFQKISSERTCESAGIPSIYCTCKASIMELNSSSANANLLANLVVTKLNEITRNQRNLCVKYELDTVLSVKLIISTPSSSYSENDQSETATEKSLIVSLVTVPGMAKFEASIQYDIHNKSYIVNSDISRINRYGDTSACVDNDKILKSICYCIDQI